MIMIILKVFVQQIKNAQDYENLLFLSWFSVFS